MIMSADQKTPNMNQTANKRSNRTADAYFIYTSVILPQVLLWLGFAINGWDGVWVFDVQNWMIIPRISQEYELIKLHYDDDMAYRYFQYTLHGIVYAYLVGMILVPIRIALSSKYPFTHRPEGQTKKRLLKNLIMVAIFPSIGLLTLSILKAPGEYLTVRSLPMSPKNIVVSSVLVSGVTLSVMGTLLMIFKIFVKGEKLYED